MIKIGILDDDASFLRLITGYVETYPGWQGREPSVRAFGSAEHFWEAFEEEPFDLVILDVVMPDVSGVETARAIYERNSAIVLAFVSSSPDHALSGYGVDAVAYMLKPVDAESVHRLMDSALSRHNRRSGGQITLKTGRTSVKLNLAEVIYLESDDKTVFFHFRDDTMSFKGKLEDYLVRLPASFIQIHKSYAVNLDHIRAMRPHEMIADNGKSVPISRRFRPRAEKLYLEHVASFV